MSKLLDDPKVAALVEKEAAKARKGALKQAQEALKARLDEAKSIEDKTTKKAVADALKSAVADVKGLAA